MFDDLDHHEWTKMSLNDFIKKYVLVKKEASDLEKSRGAEQFIQELPADFQRVSEKNGEQMDGYMKWVAGGAMGFIANIFVSERFASLCYTDWLLASLIAFGLCLLLIGASYRTEAVFLGKMPEVQKVGNRLFQYMHSVKEGDDLEAAWEKAEGIWEKLTRAVKLGLRFVTVTYWINNLAFFFFVLGVVSFTAFGTMSMISHPNCMAQDENNSVGTQQGGSQERSSQITGPMFQQFVSSLPDALAGSGLGNGTGTTSSSPSIPPTTGAGGDSASSGQ